MDIVEIVAFCTKILVCTGLMLLQLNENVIIFTAKLESATYHLPNHFRIKILPLLLYDITFAGHKFSVRFVQKSVSFSLICASYSVRANRLLAVKSIIISFGSLKRGSLYTGLQHCAPLQRIFRCRTLKAALLYMVSLLHRPPRLEEFY